MLGTLFDLLMLGFISFVLIIIVQFKTGFLMNKSFSLFGYKLEIAGGKGDNLRYVISKLPKS